MALILQIETATNSCSVALAKNGQLAGKKEANERNLHASWLTMFIQDVLNETGYSFKDLNAIAISEGPGSYTGLRIGVSTAKGLCFALDIPLIAVDTLQAMANGFISRCFSVNQQTLFCPMIDARRMEVYASMYDHEMQIVQNTTAVIIDENTFIDKLNKNIVYFFGDGAGKCEEIIGTHPNARVFDDFINSAADLSKIAYEKYQKKVFEDTAYFEPVYLKEFIVGVKKS